ncbi:MAG: ComEC/Rec2 family competence protein [Capsulimonadaceae bacterium]
MFVGPVAALFVWNRLQHLCCRTDGRSGKAKELVPSLEKQDAGVTVTAAVSLALRTLLVALCLLLTSCAPDPGKLRVTVLDVGQGDSILVETPGGHSMLVDGGGSNDESVVDPHNVGLKTVIPYLHFRGISRIDVVVLTHPHGDHVGGLVAVLHDEHIGDVLDGTVLPYPTVGYHAFLDEIRTEHIPYKHAVRGTHLDFRDGVTADVLNPPASGTAYGVVPDNSTMNNYSVVLRLTYGRTHVLLDGDAQDDAEENILATGADVTADVLKCGHHGAGNATCDDWLAHVHPRLAAISCGLHNVFGHPSPATLSRLAAHGVKTYVTAKDGAIVFVSDGSRVTASTTVTSR